MAKYSKTAGEEVKKAMREEKAGTLRAGKSGKKVTSRKRAIVTGLSHAIKEESRMPKKSASKKK